MSTRTVELEGGYRVTMKQCPHCEQWIWAGSCFCGRCDRDLRGATLLARARSPGPHRQPTPRWGGLTRAEFEQVNSRRLALLVLRREGALSPAEHTEFERVTRQSRAYMDARYPLPQLAAIVAAAQKGQAAEELLAELASDQPRAKEKVR